MNMSWIDWTIVIFFFVMISSVGIYCRKYMRGVAGFLVAGRAMGKYLGYAAGSMGEIGAISVVAFMEAMYKGGPAFIFIQIVYLVFGIVIGATGFVIKRYRETKIMTTPQLFEMRYSKGVRVLAGCICALSGILNMGIFPVVAGRFFTYFAGLPLTFTLFGFSLPTIPVFTAFLIMTAITFAFLGGQVTVIVTDFIQALWMSVMFVMIGLTVYRTINMDTIGTAILASDKVDLLLNPFSSEGTFGLKYLILVMIGKTFSVGAWSPNMQKFSSASSPKEARLIMLLSNCKMLSWSGLFYIGLAAYAAMKLPSMVHMGLPDAVAKIDPSIQSQMASVLLLSKLLPIGIMGMMFAGVMAAFISTNDSYFLTWGGVIVQDIICPLRKKPLTEKQHLWALRFAVVGVGIFVYMFGILYKPGEAIIIFQAITGAIYVAGAGTIINFGLYWKRGTTAGAYAAMIVGAIVPLLNLILKRHFGADYPISGLEGAIISYVCAATVYVVVSLMTKNPHFDLNKMLNRTPAPKLNKQES